MNLQTHISEDLWVAVSSAYESENYKHSILEAIHYLSGEIRARAGIDGDGTALASQALGGDNPRLRVNPLQTESERSIQKGVEQLLRGLYLAIRNPRSHEQVIDSRKDADAIIHFVDYLSRIINASKESFTIEQLLGTVSDSEFVESERYATLVVAEIPVNRRSDALIALYENRLTLDVRKLRLLINQLLTLLNETQLEQYLAVVSGQLRTTVEDIAIRTTLQMITPELWPRIQETARLRIETKLIREIKIGEILAYNKIPGALGTWASSYVKNFSLRAEAASVLIAKLEDTDADDRHYVAKYFLSHFPEIFVDERMMRRAVRTITSQVRQGDSNVRAALLSRIGHFPNEWQSQLAEALNDLTDRENPAMYLDDGTPFLNAPVAQEEDDIPF